MERELGSLAKHRAWLRQPPKDGPVTPFPCDAQEVFQKQIDGLVQRLQAIRCRDVVIGISGGLDSTLALLVAAGAFEKLNLPFTGIHVYTMPGFGTSNRTKDNAGELCRGLGVKLETISIVESVKLHLRDIGHDGVTPDITYENAQARMRTLILMDKANMTGGIVLGTGDLSEIALGWCTYNGDHMSMFGVNANVPKTIVRKVCSWYAEQPNVNAEAAAAIRDIVATPVSPELIADQVTEDKIGPYELHDFFLWNFIMNEMGSAALREAALKYFGDSYPEAVVEKTLATFMRRFFTQAFKRNCQPDGIRIFPFELSLRGWWIPSDLGVVEL